MDRNQNLWRKAKRLIPGGNSLLSKRPDMFLPDGWPTYFSEARGCEITDLNGKNFSIPVSWVLEQTFLVIHTLK